MKAERTFKEGLYAQLARIGKALASPHRLELLEVLAQGERPVEDLARQAGLPMANASQHLQVMLRAGLLERRKAGLYVHYRLADQSVSALATALRVVAEKRLGDLERVVREHFGERRRVEAVGMQELHRRMKAGEVVVLDTRPAPEFAAGHIAGAISLPIEDVAGRLQRLPKRAHFVAYCRGPYCVFADRAAALLQKSGRRVWRLREGFPEWRAAGLPVATS